MVFKLGVKPNGEIKDTLSYSGYSLWKRDKEGYRKRYYRNEKPFETVETIFGKKMAHEFEEDDSIIGSETEIRITLKNGLKLLSFLDSFNETDFSIMEMKTGHKNKEGKVPWDKLKVQKHKQLDFYSMMVKKKYGKVHAWVTLIWHETRFKKKEVEFDGNMLETETRDLELTGYQKLFKRRITQWERDKIEKEIIKCAKEITDDFSFWASQKSKQEV